MRQVYASHKWRRKTERRTTHVELIDWSLFFFSLSLCLFFFNSKLRRSRALRVTKKKKKKTLQTTIPVRKTKRGERSVHLAPAKYGSTSACFYITASSAFYVDASCSENMEFLKGPRTRRPHVTVPQQQRRWRRQAAAAPLWLTDGFHLVKVFKPSSPDTRVNPGSSGSSGLRSRSGAGLWKICGLSALARDQNLPWHVTARCLMDVARLFIFFLSFFFLKNVFAPAAVIITC